MKTKLSVLLLSLVVCLCAFATLSLGEEQETNLVITREIVVKPPMVAQFEEAVKEFVAESKKANYPYTWYTWWSGYNCYFFYPVKDYADMEKMFQAFNVVVEKWGKDKYQEAWGKISESIESGTDFAIRYLPQYSYAPEKARLKPEEQMYGFWDMCHVISDKEEEFLEHFKKAVSILKDNKITESTEIYAGDMGIEGPLYIGVMFGKDRVDCWEHNRKMWEIFGKEGTEWAQELDKYLRKRELKEFWYAPELSYIPEEK